MNCNACGKYIKNGYGINNTVVCRDCKPVVLKKLRASRTSAAAPNVEATARSMFRKNYLVGRFLLRDIPHDLWRAVINQAEHEQISLNNLILKALDRYCGE